MVSLCLGRFGGVHQMCRGNVGATFLSSPSPLPDIHTVRSHADLLQHVLSRSDCEQRAQSTPFQFCCPRSRLSLSLFSLFKKKIFLLFYLHVFNFKIMLLYVPHLTSTKICTKNQSERLSNWTGPRRSTLSIGVQQHQSLTLTQE